MPAIYDLANRGLLPPGFCLVGFARRDWADQDFAQIVHDVGQASTPAPRSARRSGSSSPRASGSCPATSTTTAAFDQLRRDRRGARRRTAAPAATTRSTSSIPPAFFGHRRASSSSEHGLADAPRATLAPGRHREAVRPRPRERARAQRHRRRASSRRTRSSASTTTSARRRSRTSWRCASPTSMFEPIWNANYVDHVQITMAEDIGIGGRAGYYDGIGAARDVIQNHLLQLLALIAMEEPIVLRRRGPAAEKEKVLSAVRLPSGLDQTTARGQYAGGWAGGARRSSATSRRRASIRASSTTETFAAVTLDIDTRRWAGVPFYLRTGKRLGRAGHRDRRRLQAGPAPAVRAHRDRGAGTERPRHPRPARRGHHPAVRLQGARHRRWRSATSPWTSATAASFTEAIARGLRAPHPRRPARRPAALPSPRGGRARPGRSSTRS